MAGNYYHDPRPFYGLSNQHNLISMDELFYGRKEPPPWYMHQMSHGRFDNQPRSRSMEHRRPEQYIQREDQFREYRRPDMRDDVYMDYDYDAHGATKGQQQQNHNQGHNNYHGSNNNHGLIHHHGDNNNHSGQNNNHSGHNNNHSVHNNNHSGHNNNHSGHNNNHSGHNNNHGGNNSHGGNNNHGGSNKGKNHQKQKNDSDEDDDNKSHKGGHHGNAEKSNKSYNNDHGHGHNKSWSDNKGFHGGRGHERHRRSLSLTQTVLKKLGLRDDTSNSDSSDDDRRGSRKIKTVNYGHVPTKGDHKAYTVRFDDQYYGHSHQSTNQKKGGWFEKLGEDHGSHGRKSGGFEKYGEDHGSHGKKSGGLLQGILRMGRNKHGDDGYSSDEENRGHKNHGSGKGGNHQHGGNESVKKIGHSATKHGRSQSMDYRVNLCCENCERKVKKALWKLDVDDVFCDQWNNRVVVTGNAKPETVLKKLRSVKKDTHLWH